MSTQLTPEQADAMLEQLRAHFMEPVMPISRYCDGLRTWANCIRERDGYNGSDLARAVSAVELQIRKSNLLARLLYEGEPLRTKKCPEHDGRWSGIEPCRHGCGGTGWVPDSWPDAATPDALRERIAQIVYNASEFGEDDPDSAHLAWNRAKEMPRMAEGVALYYASADRILALLGSLATPEEALADPRVSASTSQMREHSTSLPAAPRTEGEPELRRLLALAHDYVAGEFSNPALAEEIALALAAAPPPQEEPYHQGGSD